MKTPGFKNVDGFNNAAGDVATAANAATIKTATPVNATLGASANPSGAAPTADQVVLQPFQISKAHIIASGIGQLGGIAFGVYRMTDKGGKHSAWGILGFWFLGAVVGGLVGHMFDKMITPANVAKANNFTGPHGKKHVIPHGGSVPSGRYGCAGGVRYVSDGTSWVGPVGGTCKGKDSAI